MGFFDSVTKFVKEDLFSPSNQFGGKIDPFSSWLVNDWEKEAKPKRTEKYRVSPWEQDLSRGFVADESNPNVARWTTSARNAALGGGAGPAGAEAAGQRARVGGFMRLARMSPEFWNRLTRQALAVQRAREGIQTTSPQTAFLQGFGNAGGFEASGSLIGDNWTSNYDSGVQTDTPQDRYGYPDTGGYWGY